MGFLYLAGFLVFLAVFQHEKGKGFSHFVIMAIVCMVIAVVKI